MTGSDRRLILSSAAARSAATKLVGVLLSFHLAHRGFGAAAVGHATAAGLAGAVLATAALAFRGDRVGRRAGLVALSFLSAVGLVAVAAAGDLVLVLAAAFLGMVNAAGRDRGALQALDQAVLPATATDAERTRAFAFYNVASDLGRGAGDLLAWALHATGGALGASRGDLDRGGLFGAAGLLLASGLLYRALSPAVEVPPARRAPLSPGTKRRLWRLSGLFGLDAFGGGFLVTGLWATFFRLRYGMDEGTFALLDLSASVLNTVSHLVAAWLARRIGLVNTMVFTHIPSSLLLATVAFAPSLPLAIAFYLLREGLVEMDVPTRTSYTMAIVAPSERTAVSAVTNLVRIGGWAVGSYVAGDLMAGVSLTLPLLVAGGTKILYDVLLWISFRRLKPPEEASPAPAP